MSAAEGVRCDRCNVRAICHANGNTPDGWASFRIQRRKPFFDSGYDDLCPSCVEVVLVACRPAPENKTEVAS